MAQRKKKKQRDLVESLKAELTKDVPLDGCKILVDPGGEKKMSEVLLEFIAPWSQYCKTNEDLTKVLAVAVIAWNAALVPRGERIEIIENAGKAVPPEIYEDTKAIVEEMIQRREIHFAHNKRMIINYKVTITTGSGLHTCI